MELKNDEYAISDALGFSSACSLLPKNWVSPTVISNVWPSRQKPKSSSNSIPACSKNYHR